MRCPACDAQDTKVIDSRLLLEGQTVRRRRKCESCDQRFTTYEKWQIQMPAIVKNDGRREAYNRDKILRGLKTACQKRPIATAQLDSLVDSVEKTLAEDFPKEASAKELGNLVMERLYQVDPVSYVRFASFYWHFKDIQGFVSSLQQNLETSKFGEVPQ